MPMPLFLTGVVFAIAIGLRQVVPLNTDVNWLIVVCQRMLDGQHLYRDITEINPPTAAFAYLPGVALARVLGVDPRHGIDAQLLLLAVPSGEAAIGHPLVRDINGVWVSRQANLWIREFVRLTREKTVVDAATDAKLNDYLALERKWLIEDFKKLPPDLILVDNLRNDWGARARADAEVSQLLKPYMFVRSVEGIDILRRNEQPLRSSYF